MLPLISVFVGLFVAKIIQKQVPGLPQNGTRAKEESKKKKKKWHVCSLTVPRR